MDATLIKYLNEVSKKSNSIAKWLEDLVEICLSKPASTFFQTEPGKEFLKRIQKKLIEKATGFDRPTPLNLDFSNSEEVEKVLEHKDEIINFLKDKIGLEISQWYQNMAPMKNSTFVIMECIEE